MYKILKRTAPQFALKQCVDATVDALSHGCTIAHITCEHCSSAHLDEDAFASKKHTIHVGNKCGKKWSHHGP